MQVSSLIPLLLLLAALAGCEKAEMGDKGAAQLRLTAASPVPGLLEVAPYTEALTIHEYRLEAPWEDLAEGSMIRVAHWCVVAGREMECPGPDNVGEVKALNLTRIPPDFGELSAIRRQEDLPFDPDARYFTTEKPVVEIAEEDYLNFGPAFSSKFPFFLRGAREVGVVALGDSRTDAAIHPEVLGDRAFNLAIPTTGLESMDLLIEQYLLDCPNLEVVILGLSPRVIGETFQDREVQGFRESSGHQERLESSLAAFCGYFEELTPDALSEWSEERAMGYGPRGFLDYDRVLKDDWRKEFDQDLEASLRSDYSDHPPFSLSQARMEQFGEIMKKLTNANLLVVVFIPPVHEVFRQVGFGHDDGVTLEDLDQVKRQLQRLSQQNGPGISLVDLSDWAERELGNDHFANTDHLNPAGARLLTAEIMRQSGL